MPPRRTFPNEQHSDLGSVGDRGALLVLLSPVLAFLLAIAAEIVICALVDIGPPAVLVLGIGAGGLVLFRTLRMGAKRAAPGEA